MEDLKLVATLAHELWPEGSTAMFEGEMASLLQSRDALIVLCFEEGQAAGFAQCELRRDYVEGTESSPVGYLEGIYIREAWRRKGLARALLQRCEAWAKEQGCSEFASDCEFHNTDSYHFHRAVSFTEANRIICFTKRL